MLSLVLASSSAPVSIFDEFGINWSLLLGNALTFFIVAALLYYFVFKPVIAKSSERISIIEKGLKDADDAKAQLAKAQDSFDAKIKEAALESSKMIENAKEQSKSILEKATKEASEKTAIFLEKAKAQIDSEQKQLRTELKSELSDLVVKAAIKAVGDILTEEQKSKIAENSVKELNSNK